MSNLTRNYKVSVIFVFYSFQLMQAQTYFPYYLQDKDSDSREGSEESEDIKQKYFSRDFLDNYDPKNVKTRLTIYRSPLLLMKKRPSLHNGLHNNNKININDHQKHEKTQTNYEPDDSKITTRSISSEKIETSKTNLSSILQRELQDVSKDMSNKVERAIGNVSKETPENFKEIIIIKKRIISDGNRRVINLNVQDRVVPKFIKPSMREFFMRAFIGGLCFLISGILFTTTVKWYQGWLRRKYIKITEIDRFKGESCGF